LLRLQQSLGASLRKIKLKQQKYKKILLEIKQKREVAALNAERCMATKFHQQA
jgi:hypothetical protein